MTTGFHHRNPDVHDPVRVLYRVDGDVVFSHDSETGGKLDRLDEATFDERYEHD